VERTIPRFLTGAILALALSTAQAAAGWIVEGRVVGISDGDTITVLDDAKVQHKIRFAGIDAPEKGQAFGERAKQSLSALVLQKRVEARCHKKDRYGREVCAVFVSLRDVGLEQIRQGMAWHYKEYQHEQATQDQLVYRDEEESAKAGQVGLWKDPKPVPPWEWRRSDRAKR
jgi:endonuclease YncB( thermonuclease family)